MRSSQWCLLQMRMHVVVGWFPIYIQLMPVLRGLKLRRESISYQCFLFSRYIGWVTLKINYFHYLKKVLFGSKYPTNIVFNFENRSTGTYKAGEWTSACSVQLLNESCNVGLLIFGRCPLENFFHELIRQRRGYSHLLVASIRRQCHLHNPERRSVTLFINFN